MDRDILINLNGSYLAEITVIESDSAGVQPPSGYSRIDVDLNKGASGKFIYLCYKTSASADNAITGLYFAKGKKAVPPPGYSIVPVDLNKGSGGEYIYLCYTREICLQPIISLQVIHGNSGDIKPYEGYVKMEQDLNQGAGGEYIYLCYKTGTR